MSTRYRIRIEPPGEPPRFEFVLCLGERVTRPTKYGSMQFVRRGEDADGVPRYVIPAPVRETLTDYPGEEYEIVALPVASDRLGGGASGMLAAEYTLEDEAAGERVAKAKKARAAVTDPFGKKRKQRDHETLES